ncbi:putative manganese-dependent inorganic diphosphatase [bacterium]|uniref:putative manganese-dependent inorganic diphosphatase n=1 Tax=Lachnospiraceae TaxID=186803 RepID=UPI002A25A202|nr:putative manganese-dependent inorganic diphosphatase [bacterium]MDY2886803.1 putative manganese-dependent inorganic diphosphatase [Bariatricus sp.]MCI7149649.1 putative manganese-dependent inorganic diphosphatase [bacterium]MDD6514805.1 putative manganese-dependent inorganic diphosphatase [bacterium]MDD7142675.1 putative manganese-dependent inorganic diphosphatase [bacterium]
MENRKVKKTYVIGHKNPDTDSICSAIAYANLKREMTGEEYVAKRAGELNGETAYVLDRFGVEVPGYLGDVHLQVKDMDIRQIEGVRSNASIREAWTRMKQENIRTLPVTRNDRLEGLITIGDIATSYMEVYDSHILSTARTQYRNIVNTLDGTIVTGNEHGYFLKGKVIIAASSPDMMENIIEKDDLVILGNRYESQLCAIEMDASCLVICQGAEISRTIKKMAMERDIVVIQTPHDTFTAARLINQSIPVKYFMSKDNLETFHMSDYVDDVKEVMAKKKYRDFPILDNQGHFRGFLSRRRLMSSRKKQVILVDHNEKSQAVDGIEEADILEIIDHHRLGSMETIGPVFFRNQPVGCTATIVYQMYQENGVTVDKTIAALLCSAILSDTLLFRSPTCTMVDQAAAAALAQIAGINMEEHAKAMFNAGSNLREKTEEEICFQDFKVFNANGVSFGVGQITSMNQEELDDVRERLTDYLEVARVDQHLDMVFLMLTNILEESTELMCCGEGAKARILEAWEMPEDTERVLLKDVVSRKKQFIPTLVGYLQQK